MWTTPTPYPDVIYRRKSPGCAVLQVRTSAQAAIAEGWLLQRWGLRTRFVYHERWYHAFVVGQIPDELDAALVVRSRRRAVSEEERHHREQVS